MYILRQQIDIELRDILIHAAQKTEYYRAFFSNSKEQATISELSDFPFLTRKIVQRQQSHFLCGQYQRYPDIEYLQLKRSYGVSGIPLEVYWDSRDDFYAQSVLWAYRKERFGVTADEKCCVFRTAEYAGNKIMDNIPWRLSWDKKILSFSMRDLSLEWIQACMEEIFAFEPVWMCLPPSIALILAETMVLNGKTSPSSLRYIELCGEAFDTQTEFIIRDIFHVQTANVYATQTAGAVAASCTHGHLHIFSQNVLVEVIRDGRSTMDEEGDICVTSLQNTAMPLVRLKTGDKGLLRNTPCPCGQSAPILQLTRGGDCGFITTISGRKVSSLVLRSLVEYTNEEMSRCLASIRFRQKDCKCMDIILSVKPAFSGWEKEVVRVFCEKIQDPELRQMQWNIISTNPLDLDEIETDDYVFFEPWKGK